MKKFLFLIMLLSAHLCRAQNWQCLQPGVKHYFTNSNRYLRGIRIDSVKTYADSVVYYPFHTPRGEYGRRMGFSNALDSVGGSWLGKKVTQLTDGTFLFDNLRGYTVTIKSMAHLGDSWSFFSDTGSLYYQASVTALDTSTILGTLDSIKKILLTARNASGVVTSDSLNGFEIILSKNNGFCKVFDLYTFPYHKPDSAYRDGLDYFADVTCNRGLAPSRSSFQFSLTGFFNPTQSQLFDWNIGDVFENSACYIENPGNCIYPYKYFFDSVTDKRVFADSVQYSYTGWVATQYYTTVYYYPNANYPYRIANASGTFIVPNTLVFDTALMPEELNYPFLLYYYPQDSSYCTRSALYKTDATNIIGNKWVDIHFESAGPEWDYKLGLGAVHYFFFTIGNPDEETDQKDLRYYIRSGIPCGTYITPYVSSVKEISGQANAFQIFPNPATSELTINTSTLQPYTINLINTLGQTVKTILAAKQEQTINTINIPAGVYTISITDGGGNRYNEKVVIVH
jgi:hypothetical protein